MSVVGVLYLFSPILWSLLTREYNLQHKNTQIDVHLFYDDESKLYVKLCLFSNDDYGHIYIGHTMEDVENGNDYFLVNRVDWGMNRAIVYRSKKTDSVFVYGSRTDQIKIIHSSNFVISPLVQGTVEVTTYTASTGEQKMTQATDCDYDLRFRMHNDDYWYYDITMDSPKSVKHYLGVSDCYKYDSSRIWFVSELE